MKEIDASTPYLIADEIDFCLVNIEHPECTLDVAGRFYDEMGTSFRAMAISYLLLDADSDAFYAELILSAQARRHYLARCARSGYSDFYGACSRWDPFFDALASKSRALAHDIASLSPGDWARPGAEYEDDYCYARFLHRFLADDVTRAELVALLGRFERALEGASSPRLDLCKALLEKEQKAFDEAFEALLTDRGIEVEEEAQRARGRRTSALRLLLYRYVFVEGLGILWVAENAGLLTRREYTFCPALARVAMTEPPPVDQFPRI